jgi:hypothetical protein
MRPVMVVALLGTAFSMNLAEAQSAADEPAPSKAESKRAVSHPPHDGSLTENGPPLRKKREESRPTAEERPDPAPAPPAPVQQQGAQLPTVQAVAPGPPQKDLTGKEFALVAVGASVKDVLQVLGPPSSRVVVPDDDGHLRETFQYWVKGRPMGTIRLDNGRVVQIEAQAK